MIAQLNRMAAVASMAFVMVASSAPAHADVDGMAVLETYVDIALANYSDALMAARKLEDAIAALVAEPDEETLHNARCLEGRPHPLSANRGLPLRQRNCR